MCRGAHRVGVIDDTGEDGSGPNKKGIHMNTIFSALADNLSSINCRVYHDGSHYIAVPTSIKVEAPCIERKDLTEFDIYFDEIYIDVLKMNLPSVNDQIITLMKKCEEHFPNLDYETLRDKVRNRFYKKLHNLNARKKRFLRKAHLNDFNYFVTLTYDDNKHSEESFRRSLKRTLNNFATRHHWRVMGVFERAPESGRLHFHALMNIPRGQHVGDYYVDYSYNYKHHTHTYSNVNSFFLEKYGHNDFECIDGVTKKFSNTVNYILKYLFKTEEKIVYSRHIPTEVVMNVRAADVNDMYEDLVLRYVLSDDVIEYLDYDDFPVRFGRQYSFAEN